jgi:hypothetical protein
MAFLLRFMTKPRALPYMYQTSWDSAYEAERVEMQRINNASPLLYEQAIAHQKKHGGSFFDAVAAICLVYQTCRACHKCQ